MMMVIRYPQVTSIPSEEGPGAINPGTGYFAD
jgi:hypothetical protein